MIINELLAQKKMTKYRLSKQSGVPFSTISDICNSKIRIEKCSAETLYKLSKTLDVSMETLVEPAMEYRCNFETFKSNVCHMVKDMGDLPFIIDMLETDKIRKLFNKKWYPESLYLLAMVDYLSKENDLPISNYYNDIRATQLDQIIYPSSIIAMSVAAGNDYHKRRSFDNAIPEFKRFNIVENEVRNVH